jgi:hypothetical protein
MLLSFPPGTGEPSCSLNRTNIYIYFAVLQIRIRDTGSGAFLPLDPGWVKNQDPDPGLTTQMIFRELRNNFLG